MARPVTYAFGSVLGGHGIGRIAGHAVEGAHRAGLLDRAVAWADDDVAVPADHLRSVPLGRYLDYGLRYYYNDATFDLLTRFLVGDTALFHGWNNMCLGTLRRVNDSGGVTVVERASSHPAVQRRLVEEEYAAHGVEESFIDQRLYDRAVAELSEADAVFVPSEFVYESFVDQGFEESRLRLLPFGVDTGAFTPPADLARTDGEFTALFVGALSLRKGIQYLLPAWRRAAVDGMLVLVGQVTDSAQSVVAEYRDDPDIEFRGWVDDPTELYREASVFVFPSVEEGSALVSYEAMASGLPSIVTPNTGSLVEDGVHGRVVQPRDVDAIADALAELAGAHETRRRMARRARSTVEEYTWEAYGDRVATAYEELLADRSVDVA